MNGSRPIRILALPTTLLTAVLATVGCGGPADEGVPAYAVPGDHVVATNYPMAWMAGRLLGNDVEVRYPVPGDLDPSFWQPDAAAIAEMQSARVVLLNGAEYERWRSTVTLPEARVVDTAAGFRDRWLEVPDAITHSHGPGQAHSHAGTATHTWLDPELARLQAKAAAQGLAAAYPEHQDAIAQRAKALDDDLAALAEHMRTAGLGPFAGTHVTASHPVYQYAASFARLDVHAEVWEPDATPSEDEFASFEAHLAEHPARVMLWEDEPTEASTRRLAASGVQVVVYRTCGNTPATGDLLTELRADVDRLAAALAQAADAKDTAVDGAAATDTEAAAPADGN